MTPLHLRLPSVTGLALAAGAALLCLNAGVGSVIGGTQAAFNAQANNPTNAVASLYVQAPVQSSPTSAAAGLVRLSWSASPTAATRTVGYLVYRRPVGGAFTKLTASPVSALTYEDTPPADGAYEYAVQAAVSTFTSPNSNLPIATSDRTPPTIAAAATAAGGLYNFGDWTNQSVTVTFICSDTLTGVATCPSSTTVTGGGANQSVSGTTTDRAGNSRTASFSSINIDKTAPTAADGVSATPGALLSGTLNLTWDAATDPLSGIAGYDAYVAPRTLGCGAFSQRGTFGNVTAGSISGLTSGADYCVYLVARDTASNSGPASATANARAG